GPGGQNRGATARFRRGRPRRLIPAPAGKTVFITALERDDPAERDAYLAEACGGDVALLPRVNRLLRLHQGAGGFRGGPPVALDDRGETAAGAENCARVSQLNSDVSPESAAAAPSGPARTGPAAPAPAPAPPAAFGRYQVRRPLGVGGFGAVYLG